MDSFRPNTLIHRYVDIPCPGGKHKRSVVTFRNHTVAAMFCIPCELAWTESTDHPELRIIGLDSVLARSAPRERRKSRAVQTDPLSGRSASRSASRVLRSRAA